MIMFAHEMSGCLISTEVLATADYHFNNSIYQNQNTNGGQYIYIKNMLPVLQVLSRAAALTTWGLAM